MSEGWKCPGCGRCYSPFVASCSACDPSSYRAVPYYPGMIGTDWVRCGMCGSISAVYINGMCESCYASKGVQR